MKTTYNRIWIMAKKVVVPSIQLLVARIEILLALMLTKIEKSKVTFTVE